MISRLLSIVASFWIAALVASTCITPVSFTQIPAMTSHAIANQPQFFSPNVSSTLAGTNVTFSLLWTDSFGMSGFIFSYDSGSGSFANDSMRVLSGTVAWSNATKSIPANVGEKVRWKVYAEDANSQWNASYTYCFIAGAQAPAALPASYATMTDDCYDLLVYDGSTLFNVANSPGFMKTRSSFFGYHEVQWNPNMTEALLVGYNNTIASFNGRSLNAISTGLSDRIGLNSISWQPGNDSALIVGDNGTVLEYSRSGLASIASPTRVGLGRVAWSPMGKYALLLGGNGTILVFNATMGDISPINCPVRNNLGAVDFVPNGAYALISGSSGVLLKYYGSNESVKQLQGANPIEQVQYRKFSRDGKFALLTAQNLGANNLLEWNGSQILPVSTPIPNTANEITFAPDDSYALVTTTSGALLRVDYGATTATAINITTTRLRGIDWFYSGSIKNTSTSTSTTSSESASSTSTSNASQSSTTQSQQSTLGSTSENSSTRSSVDGANIATSQSSASASTSRSNSAESSTGSGSLQGMGGIQLAEIGVVAIVVSGAFFAVYQSRRPKN
ncbi:MAG: WD40 repeat domain-containing protein [Thaumarchaeota archaeon]|nr:WD40 repeat domain-containing protein [Nitrososphaerota archaeon]